MKDLLMKKQVLAKSLCFYTVDYKKEQGILYTYELMRDGACVWRVGGKGWDGREGIEGGGGREGEGKGGWSR